MLAAGDIAFRILNHMQETGGGKTGKVIVCDINDNMLRVGRQRAAAAGWQEGEDILSDSFLFGVNTLPAIPVKFFL